MVSSIATTFSLPTPPPIEVVEHETTVEASDRVARIPTKSQDPMPILEKLPQLTILELMHCNVNKLVCTAGGFPQLQFLNIYMCDAEELQVEEGGMPLLKGLEVSGTVRIPERLRSIPMIPWNGISYWEHWPY